MVKYYLFFISGLLSLNSSYCFAVIAGATRATAADRCKDEVDELKRRCGDPELSNEGDLRVATFKKCDAKGSENGTLDALHPTLKEYVSATVTYRNVPSSADPKLGAHKECIMKRDILNWKDVDRSHYTLAVDKAKNPLLKHKKIEYDEFTDDKGQPLTTRTVLDRNDAEGTVNATFYVKGGMLLSNTAGDKHWCGKNDPHTDQQTNYDDIQCPSNEDILALRKGIKSLSDIARPVVKADKLKATEFIPTAQ